MLYLLPMPRQSYAAQHGEALFLLSEALYAEYGIRHGCLLREAHGKPVLEDAPPHCSLSHCAGLIACALDQQPLGVDAEHIRQLRPRVVERVCTEAEQRWILSAQQPDLAFTRIWTLKESFVKAIGTGIAYPMREVAFSLSGNEIRCSDARFGFTQYLTADGFVIALCHAGGENRCKAIPACTALQQLSL